MEAVRKTAKDEDVDFSAPDGAPGRSQEPSHAHSGLLNLLLLFSAAATLVGSSLYFALRRFIAPDEGFYLYAARMVQEGLVPYRDFFFPQAPLAPYLFAGWFSLAGRGWVEARVFSALVTVAACLVLARAAAAVYGRRVALWSLPVFAVCIGVQVWMPTGKNTALAALFLALSLDAFLRRSSAGKAAFWIGLSVLTRATMAPAALFLLIPLSQERRVYGRQLKATLLGAAIPSAIALLFCLLDPFNFWQGNLGYHLERTGFSDRYIERQRWIILKGLLGAKSGVGIGGTQFLLLCIGAAIAALGARWAGWRHAVLPLVASFLAVVNFLPSPTYIQYFSAVGFVLVPPAVAGAEVLLRACADRFAWCSQCVLITAAVAGLCAFALLGLSDAQRFLQTGDGVPGVGKYSGSSWRIDQMSEVARAIDAANLSGKPVLSGWPGYLLESRSAAFKGAENNFAFTWSQVSNMPEAEQERRHVISQARAVRAFLNGETDVAVAYAGPRRSRPLLDALQARGAQRVAKVGWVEIVARGTP